MLVGLTGGIGAGKSTVARLLQERGAVVLDADQFARTAIEPGSPGFAKVLDGRADGLALVVIDDAPAVGETPATCPHHLLRRALAPTFTVTVA